MRKELMVLSIFDNDRKLGRRNFLRVGSLGLGGLTLPGLLAAVADSMAFGPLRVQTYNLWFSNGPARRFRLPIPIPNSLKSLKSKASVTL